MSSLPCGLLPEWILKDGPGDEGRTTFDLGAALSSAGAAASSSTVQTAIAAPSAPPNCRETEDRVVRLRAATEIYQRMCDEEGGAMRAGSTSDAMSGVERAVADADVEMGAGEVEDLVPVVAAAATEDTEEEEEEEEGPRYTSKFSPLNTLI